MRHVDGRLVITAVTIERRSKSEVARVYGVSRVWVQKLIHRFEADGERSGMVASRSPQECSENQAGLLWGSRWRLAWSTAGAGESVQFHQHEHQADQAVRESLPGVGAIRLRATIHH